MAIFLAVVERTENFSGPRPVAAPVVNRANETAIVPNTARNLCLMSGICPILSSILLDDATTVARAKRLCASAVRARLPVPGAHLIDRRRGRHCISCLRHRRGSVAALCSPAGVLSGGGVGVARGEGPEFEPALLSNRQDHSLLRTTEFCPCALRHRWCHRAVRSALRPDRRRNCHLLLLLLYVHSLELAAARSPRA